MENLGGSCYLSKDGRTGQARPWRVYSVSQPPYFVLNGLEKLAGYKVVASNSLQSLTLVRPIYITRYGHCTRKLKALQSKRH